MPGTVLWLLTTLPLGWIPLSSRVYGRGSRGSKKHGRPLHSCTAGNWSKQKWTDSVKKLFITQSDGTLSPSKCQRATEDLERGKNLIITVPELRAACTLSHFSLGAINLAFWRSLFCFLLDFRCPEWCLAHTDAPKPFADCRNTECAIKLLYVSWRYG